MTRLILVSLCATLIAALTACGSAAPPKSPAPDGPEAAPPGPPADCEVQLGLTVDGGARASHPAGVEVTLVATATNRTDAPQTLRLRDRCPSGDAVFSGFPGRFDFYGTCVAGACMDDLPPREITVDPGATVTLNTVRFMTGKSTCNEPVPAGTYPLTFRLAPVDDTGPKLCGPAPVTLEITE